MIMTEDEAKEGRRREQDERTLSLQTDLPAWEGVSTDPGPRDLDYEVIQWKRIPATDDDKIMFLPKNEDLLHEDAFIVLEDDSVCDLVERR